MQLFIGANYTNLLSRNRNGRKSFKGVSFCSLIEEKGINYDGLFKQDEQNCVIYPSELNGIKLFRNAFFHEVNVFLDLRHAVPEELEKVVVEYIDTRS